MTERNKRNLFTALRPETLTRFRKRRPKLYALVMSNNKSLPEYAILDEKLARNGAAKTGKMREPREPRAPQR